MRRVVDCLYPPRCPVCGDVLWEKGLRCHTACRGKLRYVGKYFCVKCGKTIHSREEEYCADCGRIKHHFTQGRAVYEYKEDIKDSIYRFKYKNKREYADFYAEEIEERLGDWIRNVRPDCLIPVPLHPTKQRARGYNQAELITRKLSEKLNIPIRDNLVIRCKNTVPQKELSDNKRKKNVKKAFKISQNIVELEVAMVIDDIYTTGATLDAISKVLKEAGVKEIYCLSLCIGKGF